MSHPVFGIAHCVAIIDFLKKQPSITISSEGASLEVTDDLKKEIIYLLEKAADEMRSAEMS